MILGMNIKPLKMILLQQKLSHRKITDFYLTLNFYQQTFV